MGIFFQFEAVNYARISSFEWLKSINKQFGSIKGKVHVAFQRIVGNADVTI